MCWNSHSIAAFASLLPVARSAFWHRTVGKPMASSCAIASALNSGKAGAAVLGGQSSRKRNKQPRTCLVLGQLCFPGLQALAQVLVELQNVALGQNHRYVWGNRSDGTLGTGGL